MALKSDIDTFGRISISMASDDSVKTRNELQCCLSERRINHIDKMKNQYWLQFERMIKTIRLHCGTKMSKSNLKTMMYVSTIYKPPGVPGVSQNPEN